MITDKIKTMQDVYEALGVSESEVVPFANPSNSFQKGVNAAAKLFLVAEVLNEGWEPDWDDDDQEKYYPWFSMAGGSSGFSYDGYGYDRSCSAVGSRLVFHSSKLAIYAGEQFEEVYKDLLIK